jgi:hypothetical protein
VSELVVDVIAEYIQEKHIPEDVQEASVQKGVGHELPQVRMDGREHKLHGPIAQYLACL